MISNTVLFFISTFSSKFLVFLLMPIYTQMLTTQEYNAVNLIMQTANIMIPLASFGMANGIIRFGLDNKYSKVKVFTVACKTYFLGFMFSLLFYPVIINVDIVGEYAVYVYIYLFASCLRTLVQQFTRARTLTRLYAVDGILATVNTLLLVYILLVRLDMGPVGYILAIIGADLLSALFLSVFSGSFKYLKLKSKVKQVSKEMIFYCLPFIPNSMFWWITNVSDHFLVSFIVGEDVGGLYAAAYKLPGIIVLCSTVFTEAWQISAVKESGQKTTNKFFNNVFSIYQSLIFIAAAFLILTSQFFMSFMVADNYFIAWEYIPILIIATVFSCFATFLSSIYMVEKNGKSNLLTMMAAAIVNIILNLILIPEYGAQGAGISTLISYFTVFFLRAIGTRKYIKLKFSPVLILINLILSLYLSYVVISQRENWLIFGVLIVGVTVIINAKAILSFLNMLMKNLKLNRR